MHSTVEAQEVTRTANNGVRRWLQRYQSVCSPSLLCKDLIRTFSPPRENLLIHDFAIFVSSSYYSSHSSSSSLNPLSPYWNKFKRWFFHWTSLDSPEVCTDTKRSFLCCRTSLQETVEVFQSDTKPTPFVANSSVRSSGVFNRGHFLMLAHTYTRAVLCGLDRCSAEPDLGLALRDINQFVCLGRNFARPPHALLDKSLCVSIVCQRFS